MSKFMNCYEANGMMWCTYPSGKKAKPFRVTSQCKKKKPKKT